MKLKFVTIAGLKSRIIDWKINLFNARLLGTVKKYA